uniref:Envelope protein n=2 Tax=Drosophila ananassae TaxID=7217 RepID=V9H1L4_DROAN
MILSLLLTMSYAQQIQIGGIDTNHGYLLFSSKPIQRPSAFEHHCLTVNLTEINTITTYFGNKIQNSTDTPRIKFLYNKLIKELNGITLHKERRQKRGLFNFVGSAFKFLFGTLDDNDRIQFEEKLNSEAENSIKIHEFNEVMQFVNDGLQRIKKYENNRNSIDTLVYELMQFIEYIEDLEMGMQLSRLGLFNPKLLNYDKLQNVNSENILLTKTSTWINYKNNEILIISHIPINHVLINTIKIIPYPDRNGYQLEYSGSDSYFENDNKIYNQDNKEVNSECIANIIKRRNPTCNFVPALTKEIIKYIEPNVIITWNLTQTTLTQNCQNSNSNIQIKGNKIIRITQCKVKIENIILSENYLHPEIDLTPLYPPLNITKIKILKHNDIIKMISQNNITLYTIIIPAILALVAMILILKYINFNPFIFLYIKLRKQTERNQPQLQENELGENPLPTLYPSMPAQV